MTRALAVDDIESKGATICINLPSIKSIAKEEVLSMPNPTAKEHIKRAL